MQAVRDLRPILQGLAGYDSAYATPIGRLLGSY